MYAFNKITYAKKYKSISLYNKITNIFFRCQDNERLYTAMENIAGDKRKEPPLPPIKGDGSVDYDGESTLPF